MNVRRMLRHLLMPPWRVRQLFAGKSLEAIERAIRASEATHHGQICFAVEAALEFKPLARDQSARERALEVFGQMRVWDTEHNNGVLLYVLLADHDVEILADRGIHRHVPHGAWEHICQQMEAEYRAGRYEAGTLAAIRAVGELLATHYPGPGARGNELPDRPTIF